MHILGINAYHGGASACLIRDGQLVAAAEEERFSRIKYQAGFPRQAIRYVLAEGAIAPADLDHIGISRRPSANLVKKALFAFRRRPSLNIVRDRLNNAMRIGDLKSVFAVSLGVPQAELSAQFHNVEHHRAL
jgi:carbamoyltransferase